MVLSILVVPRASRTRVMGIHDGRLKIQLTSPPADGKANEALVRFLADTLAVSKVQIEITSGATSKHKTVRVDGVAANRALMRLSPRKL